MLPDTVMNELITWLGCRPSDVKLLGGYNSNVFEILPDRGVVKILGRTSVSEADTLGEIEWQEYLVSKKVRVARPLRLSDNELIHSISGEYYVVMYDKINGSHVNPQNPKVWNSALFEKWGEATGKMHTAAKCYHPAQKRPQWNEHIMLQKLESSGLDPILIQKWRHYGKEFERLPSTRHHFGLIHGDLHHGNLIVQEDELTLIDFGDSEYHWFAYDIAVAVYHAAQTVDSSDREAFVKTFFQSFMTGYKRGNANTPFLSQIDYFIDYRHLFSYTYHFLYADYDKLTEKQLSYLNDMKQSLILGSSFLGFSLAQTM